MQIEVSVHVTFFPALLPLQTPGMQAVRGRLRGTGDFAFSPSKFFLWLLLETNKK